MQFKTLLVAAGLAAAAPQPRAETAIVSNPAFRLQSIRSGSDLQYAAFKAANSALYLNLKHTQATCDASTDGSGYFYLNNGELYLYRTENPPQQVYVDRSGMGQGKIGYTTGAQSPPTNAELNKFSYTSANGLTFDGAGFIACPGATDNSYSLWISAGVTNPGGNSNCVGIKANVIDESKPVNCLYTQ